MAGDVNPVPADDVGAEMAVVRPHFPELAGFLDATTVPLDVAYGLDDDRLEVVAGEVGRVSRLGEAGRLVVGAALYKRRSAYERGTWTPFVTAFADRVGVSARTLGDWMLAAERHYGLELPKAAKPTLRAPRPKLAIGGSADSEDAAGDATNAPAAGAAVDSAPVGIRYPGPGAAPGGDDSPGAGVSPPDGVPLSTPGGGGTPGVDRPPVPASGSSTRDEEPREDPPDPALIRPLCPECDSPVAWDGSGWQHADGRRYRHKIVLPHPEARRFEGSSGETATKAHTPDLQPDATPPVARTTLSVALDAVLDAQATKLAKLAEAERTKVAAAHRALGRALRDTEHRVGHAAPVLPGQVPARESAGEAPDAPAQAGCAHPKGKRQVKSWGTVCGDCGARVS